VFKKLLVPLDGSDLAEAVLPYVEDLGNRCAAEVILLQVVATPSNRTTAIYRPPKGDMPMPPLPESAEDVTITQHPIYREQEMASLRAEAEQSLAGAKERLGKAGLEVRVEVLFGQPAEKIVEYAMKEEVDLIAMATHGRSGFSRWVFGSVAEKVLRAIALPVLLIRPPGADRYVQLPGVDLKL
jgi:nucleotide-binding universal stress UspA family protein